MSTAEIEQDRTEDAHGRRPPWTAEVGSGPREEAFLRQQAARAHGRAHGTQTHARGARSGGPGTEGSTEHAFRRAKPPPTRRGLFPGTVRRACRTLGYDGEQALPALEDLKAHYKALVRELHPDLNGADRDREEELKRVNAAYSVLCRHLVERKLH